MEEKNLNYDRTFDMRWRSFLANLVDVNEAFRSELSQLEIDDVREAVIVKVRYDEINESLVTLEFEDESVMPEQIALTCQALFDRYFEDYCSGSFR
jgi:hypothetical protein